MPTLNRIRLVNIKYSDDKRIVRDELINLNGQNTLALFENAGGKSVLTKFMMQPIMWIYDQYPPKVKEPYFNMKSFFKTNTEPCYVLEEFELENNEGYLLLGVGIQKGDEGKPLTKISFVHHYKNRGNAHSIHNIQLFTKKNDLVLLLGLNDVINSLKSHNIKYYRSGNSDDKQAFCKQILEYHINIREWEKVHARIVSMEGGLEEIFIKSNTKNTKDLLRNWILEAIEGKVGYITDDLSQISQIRAMLAAHIQQKIESKADMDQLDLLRLFVKDIDSLCEYMKNKEQMSEEYDITQNNLIHISQELLGLLELAKDSLAECDASIATSKKNISHLKYQSASYSIKKDKEALDGHLVEFNYLSSEKENLESDKVTLERKIKYQHARKALDELNDTSSEIEAKQEALRPLSEKVKEIDEKTRNIKYTINQICTEEISILESEIKQCREKDATINNEINSTDTELRIKKQEIVACQKEQTELNSKAVKFETVRDRILIKYPDIPAKFAYKDFVEENAIHTYHTEANNSLVALSLDVKVLNEEEPLKVIENETALEEIRSDELKKQSLSDDLTRVNQEYDTFIQEKGKISDRLRLYHFKDDAIDQKEKIILQISKQIEEKDIVIKEEEAKQNKLLEQIRFYKNDQLNINPIIERSLRQNGIDYTLGLTFLKNYDVPMEDKIELIRNNPVLPYAILVSEAHFEKIKKIIQREFTDSVIPVLIKNKLESIRMDRHNSLIIAGENVGLYAGYNEELIDKVYIQQQLQQVENALSLINVKIGGLKTERNELNKLLSDVSHYPYNQNTEGELLSKAKTLSEEIEVLDNNISRNNDTLKRTKLEIEQIRKDIKKKEELFSHLKEKVEDIKLLVEESVAYYQVLYQKEVVEDKIKKINNLIETKQEYVKELIERRANNNNILRNLNSSILNIQKEDAEFLNYTETGRLELTQTGEKKSKSVLKEMLEQFLNMTEYHDVKQIQQDIGKLQSREAQQIDEFERYNVQKEDIRDVKYKPEFLDSLNNEKDDLEEKIKKVERNVNREELNIENLEKKIDDDMRNCYKIFHLNYDQEAKDLDYNTLILDEEENIRKQGNERIEYASTMKDIERILPDLKPFKEMSITKSVGLVAVDLENFDDMFREYSTKYRELDKKINEINRHLDKLFNSCENIYIVKRDNAMIGNYLAKMKAYPKSSTFQIVKEKILMQIDFYSGQAETLNKEFEEIYGTSLDYTKKVHEQLLGIDKNSKIDGKKLFELAGILKEGTEERFVAFLDDVVMEIVEGKKEVTNLDNVINTYNLLNNFINLESIQAYALKFDKFEEQKKVKFEDTHNNGVCSGAQRTIIAFAIIKCIMYYTNEGLILDNKNSTSFMFLDNPFGVMSTKQYLDIFFKIAERFHTTTFAWTDLSKPEIIKKHRNIYSFKIKKSGKKEYIVIKDDAIRDPYEVINTSYLHEEQQLEFNFE